jgi:hypothetical protein
MSAAVNLGNGPAQESLWIRGVIASRFALTVGIKFSRDDVDGIAAGTWHNAL